MIKNAMTVDVEDYFQVSAFEKIITRDDWQSYPHRVELNTHKVLDLFEEKNIKATFYTLGWVAELYPGIVKRIVDDGHELASHGYYHVRVVNQNPAEFYQDITRTKALLEDIGGVEVKGYRAASYSIGSINLWAYAELERAGYLYSSSIYPIKHDLYGMPGAPRFKFHPNEPSGILEIPVSTLKMFGKTFPCGGGGFFRFYPYALSSWALRRMNDVEGQSGMFYFHPWEIDPEQPRIAQASRKAKFRHYLNLDKTHRRLECLIDEFSWQRMDETFLDMEKVAAER
ncbi:MAG: DUF3473 domain-containing protein [Gammaproteobacteria bacterium]|nr:DUF3473 domain-containing protein [Gammaproteobacteria bacterium]